MKTGVIRGRLTLVIHDQTDSVSDKIARSEESLLSSDLPNIPFHSPVLASDFFEMRFPMAPQGRLEGWRLYEA